MHEVTVERKNSLLTGRNLGQNLDQEGRPSASTSWGLRGQEGTTSTITPGQAYLLRNTSYIRFKQSFFPKTRFIEINI